MYVCASHACSPARAEIVCVCVHVLPRLLGRDNRRAWLKAVEAEPRAIWIVKPPASSCGRGIRVINKASVASVSKSKKGLVQVRLGVCHVNLHQ